MTSQISPDHTKLLVIGATKRRVCSCAVHVGALDGQSPRALPLSQAVYFPHMCKNYLNRHLASCRVPHCRQKTESSYDEGQSFPGPPIIHRGMGQQSYCSCMRYGIVILTL